MPTTRKTATPARKTARKASTARAPGALKAMIASTARADSRPGALKAMIDRGQVVTMHPAELCRAGDAYVMRSIDTDSGATASSHVLEMAHTDAARLYSHWLGFVANLRQSRASKAAQK